MKTIDNRKKCQKGPSQDVGFQKTLVEGILKDQISYVVH